MRDHFLWLVSIVVVLTLLSAGGAVTMAFCMPSPASIAMERLFETFLSLAMAGFFAILSLLATLHVAEPRKPPSGPGNTLI